MYWVASVELKSILPIDKLNLGPGTPRRPGEVGGGALPTAGRKAGAP